MPRLSHPGVAFLDRDGTINAKPPDGDYVKRADELVLLPGVARAIRRLNDGGVGAIVVTNQRGIALGLMSELDLEQVHAQLASSVASQAGARLDAIFHCPHDIGQCDCRKPGLALFHQAQARFPWIELERSVMIGDSATDVEAGRRVGMTTLQIGVDVPDLSTAVDRLLG